MSMKASTTVLCVGLVMLPFAMAEDDPDIGGKPLSELVKQLRSENRGFQVRASRALSEAPTNLHARIVPQVLPVLKSERENDKFVAAQILGEYGPVARAAVPDLLPMLGGTQYERNRAAAAKALGQILRDSKAGEDIEKVTDALVTAFGDAYPDVRREAVHALGVIGVASKRCVPKLVLLLGDQEQMVRAQAAWTCGQMGPLAAEHMDRLISLMHAEWTPEVVEGIGKIGPVNDNVVLNIVDRMEIASNQGWSEGTDMALWPFGSAAMKALQRFGPKAMPALPYLMKLLPDKSGSDTVDIRARLVVIAEVTRTIGAIGPAAKAAIPRLEVMTTFRNHPHGDNTQALLDDLHAAGKAALAAVKGN